MPLGPVGEDSVLSLHLSSPKMMRAPAMGAPVSSWTTRPARAPAGFNVRTISDWPAWKLRLEGPKEAGGGASRAKPGLAAARSRDASAGKPSSRNLPWESVRAAKWVRPNREVRGAQVADLPVRKAERTQTAASGTGLPAASRTTPETAAGSVRFNSMEPSSFRLWPGKPGRHTVQPRDRPGLRARSVNMAWWAAVKATVPSAPVVPRCSSRGEASAFACQFGVR